MNNFIHWNEDEYNKFYLNNGSVVAHAPYHPRANCRGYVPRSRLIMENHLGRYLDENEMVRRIDGNKMNDNIENLKLIPPVYYSWESYPDDKWTTLKKYPNYEITVYGKIRNKLNNKIQKGGLNHSGYVVYGLKNDKGNHREKAHRLVAETFIDNPKNREIVNHKNGIKTDNRVENLEWCTRLENNQHAFENNLSFYKGDYNKLSYEDIRNIKALYKTGKFTYYDLAKNYGVSYSHIGYIVRGQTRLEGE